MKNIKKLAIELFDLENETPSRSGGAHEVSLESVLNRSDIKDQWPVDTGCLAQYIDHTILKPEATDEDVIKISVEAEKYKFRSVCVNPYYAKLAKQNLPTVDLCCVVGFPLGANTTAIKAAETALALEHGAKEIDMVINVGALKSEEYQIVYEDILALSETCHNHQALLKVILETCLLDEEEIIIACLLSKKAGADFVKTSTGFNKAGATVEHIELMRRVVGPKMGVKASGGIRDTAKALALLKAGANRIGASSSISIIS